MGVEREVAVARRNNQGTDRIHFPSVEIKLHGWRLTFGRPGAMEMRPEAKATFVYKNQVSGTVPCVFLSAAKHSVSNEQCLIHRAGLRTVEVFDNSSPSAPADTR